MAPVLLCPECGTKHPLDGIGSRSAFPCSGLRAHAEGARRSRRSPSPDAPLPVGAGARRRPPVAGRVRAGPAPPDVDPHATQVFATRGPAARAAPVGEPRRAARRPAASCPPRHAARRSAVEARSAPDDLIPPVRHPVPAVVRRGPARVPRRVRVGARVRLAHDERGHRRRARPRAGAASGRSLRLLPFVALATAGIVQGGVYGIARLRGNRRRTPRRPAARTRARAERPPAVSRRGPTRSSRPPAGASRRRRSRRDSARCAPAGASGSRA